MSILEKKVTSSRHAKRNTLGPPTTHEIMAPDRYNHRRPSHWAFCVLRMIRSTLVLCGSLGNMKPAWVMRRALCKKWYADVNMQLATMTNCVTRYLRLATAVGSMLRRISHNRPVMTVNNERTVVDKNVWAVMAFRKVCTAYNQPWVSRTYWDHRSRVSA